MNDATLKDPVSPALRLHAADNVLVARVDIAKGEPILEYDTVIGFAAADIRPGTLLHRHNMEFREFERDYAFCADDRPVKMFPESERAGFMDINCCGILDGTASMQQMGERIFELILGCTSEEKSKSELLGLGGYEFVPWPIGITG